jgi:hypothetical protein
MVFEVYNLARRSLVAQRFSLACQAFLFSLGVSRGDISLFQRERNEIMKGGELLISAKRGSMGDSAIYHQLRPIESYLRHFAENIVFRACMTPVPYLA